MSVAVGEAAVVDVGVGVAVGVAVDVDVGDGVNVAVAAVVEVGVDVTDGVGVEVAVGATSARRGRVMLLRESVTDTPAFNMRVRSSSVVSAGYISRNTSQAPAACGAAIDVPRHVANVAPGTDDSIHSPGASIDRNDALFENVETESAGVAPGPPSRTEPTLTAVEMQAGAPSPLV